MLCSVALIGYGLSVIGGFMLGGPLGQLIKRVATATATHKIDALTVPA